ncbi:MAG: sugar phosphate isomerase/epimerase family protein, partial [Armatimonadota bacterium]
MGNPIAVSTYSFWQFRREELRSVELCIDRAAAMGFDGVEVLHRQLDSEDPTYLQRLKRQAFVLGLPLCGLSIHQGFVSPDPEVRRQNVAHTARCIELAYSLGIPTVRVNTGRWGTIADFDTLMAHRGIEPILPGYTENDGFEWVIDCLGELLPVA